MNEQETLKPYVIGLDLGGTNSVFGIVDSRGEIKATTAIKTQGYDRVEDYVNASVEALQIIIEQVGGIDKIKAMGIGAPNGNYYNGTIEFAPNLSWGHNGIVPLAKLFSDRLGIPVALTNDANAAAIGEMIYGVARGMKNFIVITLGTGVGSGIVINGQLVYGCDGFAGELGHVIMKRENGRSCGCGRNGCLEAYCSATGVARSARELLLSSDRPSILREMNRGATQLTAHGAWSKEERPVVMSVVRHGSQYFRSPCSTSMPSGICIYPSRIAALTMFTIDLPARNTFLPYLADMFIICCTRWMLEANVAAIMRRSLSAK